MIPFLGICLGMQCAVIEFARNKCGIKNANSSEFDEDGSASVVCLMSEQKKVVAKGGTMRLGAYPAEIDKSSLAYNIYSSVSIQERHRHRYEINNEFRNQLKANGMIICGTSPDRELVEIVEIKDHPWFLACQFHPEFKSKPLKAHPLFKGFIQAAILQKNKLMV